MGIGAFEDIFTLFNNGLLICILEGADEDAAGKGKARMLPRTLAT
jgi:hypothetical protein